MALERLLGWSQQVLSSYTKEGAKVVYREVSGEEINNALDLAWKVFLKFEAPDYPKSGIEAFYESIHDEQYLSQLKIFGAYLEDALVGVMATRSQGNHVALFFVEEQYQRQGIGKGLFNLVKEYNTSGSITVNSSPYAVPVLSLIHISEPTRPY